MNIYCDGGAETIHQLLQEDLIDEMIISIIPVLLGDGIRLFKGGFQVLKLQLINVKSFEKGLVQMRYIFGRRIYKCQCISVFCPAKTNLFFG